ncbi:ABC transporter substrate binding protein [Romboutsia sp.]|uniref:sensor histidine kinase n=1 Tax=Romboutsia sp. TaxID=1965302 RepID=UPI003F2BFDEE
MNINKHTIICALVTIICFLTYTDIISGQDNKEVLFLGSYSNSFENYNKQIHGFKRALDTDINMQIEYLDYGNFAEVENEINFYNLLKHKISKYEKYEAIILAEDHAIRFWQKYKDELFKDTPMIFLGANDVELVNQVLQYENVYGIKEEILVEENIKLIRKLHPDKDIVALIYEPTSKSKEINDYYNLKGKYKDTNFNHISVYDDGIEQAQEKLKKLDKNSVILEFYTYGKYFIEIENLNYFKNFINNEVNLPKYTTIDFKMNDKFIGGFVTDPYKQGEKGAEIANQISNGKFPAKKLISGKEANTYLFNYESLKKFNIKESKLPQGSHIENKPIPILKSHKEISIVVLVIVACLIITIVALILNVIKRKQYEKEILKAKEIAEKAHNVQSDFISTISHELRTPVAIIMSCNQLLELNLSKLGDEVKNKNDKSISIIKQNCYRMIKIVNNIIDVAKFDSEIAKLKLKNIEIISLLEDIALSVVPYAKCKNIELIFDTQKEELITSVDPDMIERIVLNLLSNAIKFTNENGKILMSVYCNQDKLIFTVKDNGIGIAKENIEKIFEKFVQLEDTISRTTEGSGIGLSLVKSLVELHDGEIFVISKLSEGTSFSVELPIKKVVTDEIESHYSNGELIHIRSAEIEFSDMI